jgi:hypothetical protein
MLNWPFEGNLYPTWDCFHIFYEFAYPFFPLLRFICLFLATRFFTPLNSGLCPCKNKCLHLSNIWQKQSILLVFAVATSNRVIRSWKLTCLQSAEFCSRKNPNWIQWCDWIGSEFYDWVNYWMSTYQNSTGIVWVILYFMVCVLYKSFR